MKFSIFTDEKNLCLWHGRVFVMIIQNIYQPVINMLMGIVLYTFCCFLVLLVVGMYEINNSVDNNCTNVFEIHFLKRSTYVMWFVWLGGHSDFEDYVYRGEQLFYHLF